MEKIIEISGQKVKFKATAATPITVSLIFPPPIATAFFALSFESF